MDDLIWHVLREVAYKASCIALSIMPPFAPSIKTALGAIVLRSQKESQGLETGEHDLVNISGQVTQTSQVTCLAASRPAPEEASVHTARLKRPTGTRHYEPCGE